MARKQRTLSDEKTFPHDRFLSMFRRSSEGRKILAEMELAARLEEDRLGRRNGAYDQLLEAERIAREELPEVEAELRNAGGHYHAVVTPAARRVNAAKAAVARKRQQIEAIRQNARRTLMDTAGDAERDAADVRFAIQRDAEHIAAHGFSVELPAMQEQLRDVRASRGGKLRDEAELAFERQVQQSEAVEKLLPAFRVAVERLRAIEVDVVDDVPALIDKAVATLPTQCPFCEKKLRRHRQARESALKAGER